MQTTLVIKNPRHSCFLTSNKLTTVLLYRSLGGISLLYTRGLLNKVLSLVHSHSINKPFVLKYTSLLTPIENAEFIYFLLIVISLICCSGFKLCSKNPPHLIYASLRSTMIQQIICYRSRFVAVPRE